MINLNFEFNIKLRFSLSHYLAGLFRSLANWFYDARAPETINVFVFVDTAREGRSDIHKIHFDVVSYVIL